jgi:hypothetical protein
MLQVLRGDAIWCLVDAHVHGAGVGFLGALAFAIELEGLDGLLVPIFYHGMSSVVLWNGVGRVGGRAPSTYAGLPAASAAALSASEKAATNPRFFMSLSCCPRVIELLSAGPVQNKSNLPVARSPS